jgi:uncharacterized protein involved in exopolysaccharide biosynthesis
MSLLEILRILCRSWRRSLIITVLCVGTAAVYAYTSRQWFQADTVLSSADHRSTTSAVSQLAGLASIAGVSLPTNDSVEPLAVLRSRDFARRFIEREGIAGLLAPPAPGQGAEATDIRDAVMAFASDVRSVGDDKKTGLVTVSIRWTNPVLAAEWANKLVAQLNDELRARAEAEASQNLAYLQAQMGATGVVSLQQSIGRLIELELQKQMLAKRNSEFAFRVIDVATTPKYRSSPRRLMIMALAAFVGLLVSAAIAVASHVVAEGWTRTR